MIKRDIEAIKRAVSLLEIHPGIRENPNSQEWLARLRAMLPDKLKSLTIIPSVQPLTVSRSSTPFAFEETQKLLGQARPFKSKCNQ